MNFSQKDRRVLRDLAKRTAAVAARPDQKEKADLWRRLNRLERVRPMIYLENCTWPEMMDHAPVETEGELARRYEFDFRIDLHHAENIPDDKLYSDTIYSPVVMHETDMGVESDPTVPDHEFGASRFNCVLDDDASPELIPMPTLTVDWEATQRAYESLRELYEGILNVEIVGRNGFGFCPVDTFATWRGLEKFFTDLIDRPEWVHAWLDRMTRHSLKCLELYEEHNVLALNNGSTRVFPGGYGLTDELPRPDFDGTHVRACDMWGGASAQVFCDVSPAMHEEFALQYEGRVLRRFGLSAYGCCEPLDAKMDILRKALPNLRRVSMSSWIDVARGADAVGMDMVFSYKPNPAVLSGETWDVDYAREQLRDVFQKTRGCVIEVIMKDLHTTRRQPHRMREWVVMARELAEEYA